MKWIYTESAKEKGRRLDINTVLLLDYNGHIHLNGINFVIDFWVQLWQIYKRFSYSKDIEPS